MLFISPINTNQHSEIINIIYFHFEAPERKVNSGMCLNLVSRRSYR
jgi:hypothetical protein